MIDDVDKQIEYHNNQLTILRQMKRADRMEEIRRKSGELVIGTCYSSEMWPASKFVAILTGRNDMGELILSWFHLRDDSVQMASNYRVSPSDFFRTYSPISRTQFNTVYVEAQRQASVACASVEV